jgi:integrase
VAGHSSTPNFKEFAETWFAANEPRWKHSYKITLRTSLDKQILPTFAEAQLDDVSKSALLAFRTNLAKIPRKNGSTGLSPAYINHVMVSLRSILNEAAERYGFDSPFKNIKPLKVARTDVKPSTLEEVQRRLERVRPDYRNYLVVRFFTGMRTGEVHGLKWEHVDFEHRHTAATLWLAAGENLEWITRQMGHSTTEMLFRIYSRYVPNLTRQHGSAFASLLKRTLGD